MPKGKPNKRYTPEFKKLVIETMREEKLSYRETARRFGITSHQLIQEWERIYLTEGPEGFAVERRGRGGTGLGLALVRSIAGSHGSTVYIEKNPGSGSRFVLELPAEATAEN